MSAVECTVCGETDCKLAHDCSSCSNDATTECDRLHLTCKECSWWVGDGPDAKLLCQRCEDEAQDYDEDGGAERAAEISARRRETVV